MARNAAIQSNIDKIKVALGDEYIPWAGENSQASLDAVKPMPEPVEGLDHEDASPAGPAGEAFGPVARKTLFSLAVAMAQF